MNCEHFRRHWTDWREGWLEEGAADMVHHRETCAACARYDRQMRRLVGALSALPLPDSMPAAAGGRRPSGAASRAAAPRWLALAATLVLGVALGLLIGHRSGGGGETIVAEPVALEAAGERRIAIAIDSPRSFEHVEFVVELPAGVELLGFPGQRSVRWEGRLAAGRSRLQLPLRVAPDAEGGRLVTRIVRPDGERRLVVPLQGVAGSATRASGRV